MSAIVIKVCCVSYGATRNPTLKLGPGKLKAAGEEPADPAWCFDQFHPQVQQHPERYRWECCDQLTNGTTCLVKRHVPRPIPLQVVKLTIGTQAVKPPTDTQTSKKKQSDDTHDKSSSSDGEGDISP
jgi:hypothetical protein